MRAFLRASDALDEAATSTSSDAPRDIIDKSDAKALAEMTLRKHLEDAGWSAPQKVPVENDD